VEGSTWVVLSTQKNKGESAGEMYFLLNHQVADDSYRMGTLPEHIGNGSKNEERICLP
jgi:hypothetical protein